MYFFPQSRYGRQALALFLLGIFGASIFIFCASGSAQPIDTLPVRAEDQLIRSMTDRSMTETRPTTETNKLYLPIIIGTKQAKLTIAAAHIDSAISGEADEAILLWNSGEQKQSLAGWTLVTNSRRATFPLTTTAVLAGGQPFWCSAEASAFRASFGKEPSCAWVKEHAPTVLTLDGKLGMANSGGYIQLHNPDGQIVDTLVYGNEERPQEGWDGPSAQSYSRGAIPAVGQVWQRKRDPSSGQPVDTDQASDWAGDLTDLAWGRQVHLPGWAGWDQADFTAPALSEAHANMTVLVGPEGLYRPLAEFFRQAHHTIDLSLYTFEHPELAQVVVDALQRGVAVRLLLEGSPPGGIDDLQKWTIEQIVEAGGEVRYMAVADDAPNGYRVRYRYMHAKYGVIDGQQAMIGTENFNWDSIPTSDGPVGGRRGFYLLTDAEPVVSGLAQLFDNDWQPTHFLDLHPFSPEHPTYGSPPDDFVLPEPPVYNLNQSPFADPYVIRHLARFSLINSPDNATRPDSGMMALIHRAGPGDRIRIAQLYEHKHWGDSVSNPIADPNPRLQALIDAARRGATVHILLDRYFDDEEGLRSNWATVAYLRSIAASESLPLEARLGNPTQGGLHAKMLLIRLTTDQVTEYWSAVGSLNGGEVSHKLNREVVLLTDMAGVYQRLSDVFTWDWQLGD